MILDRIITNIVRAGRFAINSVPYLKSVADPALEKAGSIIGKGGVAGFKGIAGKIGSFLGKIAEEKETGNFKKSVIKNAGRAGRVGGHLARELEDVAVGIDNGIGVLTNGIEAKRFNNVRNKIFKTDKYTGRRIGQLLKDSDESIILGKKATKLGTTLVVGTGAIVGTKDAIEDRVRKQQGRYTGTSGNAPTNTYAYQGASYADNAGATGDLVLSMHRQRHTGIL